MLIHKIRDFMLALAVLVMFCAMFVAMVITWAEHPAEQPISGHAYMEQLQGGDAR